MLKLFVPLTQIAIGLLFIGAWHGVSASRLIDPTIFPPPAAVATTLVGLLKDPTFLNNAGATLVRVVVAFLIGAPIALTMGFVLGENAKIGKTLGPLFTLVLAVPQSIFLPIFVLLFGLGFIEKLMFGISHVFFVVVVNTMAAVREVSHPYVVAARSFGAGRWRIYRSIYLPAIAPHVVTGLRYGMIYNIIGILLAEMYASETGLGVLLSRWGETYDVRRLMAATLIISVATILINEVMRRWESRISRWQRAAEQP
jgi:NitT/TauT family transport system permease protein